MNAKKIYYLDLLERAVWTFVQGFLAVWIVTADISVETFSVAAVAGAVSVAKSILGRNIGDKNSAATLPSPPDFAGDKVARPDDDV